MATVAPPAEQAADMLQKLSIDTQPKTLEVVPEATKKPQYGSVNATESNGQIQSCERSATPAVQDYDPSLCYLQNGYPSTAYYYGGYDGSVTDWEEYSRYVNPEGVDMSQGVYGDNGSLLYGYGYAPYGAYNPAASPVPSMGHDGQLYAPQHYQYPTPYYQPPTPPPSGPYTPNQAPTSQVEVSTSVAADQAPVSVEPVNANGNVNGGVAKGGANKNSNGSAPLRSANSNSSVNSNGSYGRGVLPSGIPAGGYDPRFGYDGMRSPVPWMDGPVFSDGHPRTATSSSSLSSAISHINNNQSARNQNLRPLPNLMGLHSSRPTTGMGPTPGYMNRMYPNSRMYGQCGNTMRTGPFGSNGYDSRTSGRGWYAVDNKYKPRGRGNGFFGYGNENMDGLNELNRGPRARGFKNQKGFTPVAIAVKGQNLPSNGVMSEEKDSSTVSPNKEDYNKADFPEKYSEAKFFIIKSYSEDDVHKSIKYSVWASTPNGNKKLDAGYREAQEKPDGCPVFLFFSVNTSGQFVGLAEMVGPVDFNKNCEYWQQDKWNGCFPLKWHVVKDVPNSLLKHITLENNDNKPVTNSRDTQEVKFEQGLQMIKIFKDHTSKTCILDDFGFYEARQKTMQEKRAKQQQFQKQVWDSKAADVVADEKEKEGSNGKVGLQKTVEVASPLIKELTTIQGDVEQKLPEESGVAAAGAGDAPKGVKPAAVTEKRVPNGVANGC